MFEFNGEKIGFFQLLIFLIQKALIGNSAFPSTSAAGKIARWRRQLRKKLRRRQLLLLLAFLLFSNIQWCVELWRWKIKGCYTIDIDYIY